MPINIKSRILRGSNYKTFILEKGLKFENKIRLKKVSVNITYELKEWQTTQEPKSYVIEKLEFFGKFDNIGKCSRKVGEKSHDTMSCCFLT